MAEQQTDPIISRILSTTLKRPISCRVEVSTNRKFNGPAAIATYRGEGEEPRMLLYMDQLVAISIGAAFTRIPPGAITRSLPSDTKETITRNLNYACNAIGPAYSQNETWKLNQIEWAPRRLLPIPAQKFLEAAQEGTRYFIEISDYKSGEIVVATAAFMPPSPQSIPMPVI